MEPPVYYISKCFFVILLKMLFQSAKSLTFDHLCCWKNHGCAGESRRPTKLSIPQSGSSELSERRPSPRTGRDDLRNFTYHDRSLFEAWKSPPKLVAELFRLMEYYMIYTENWDIFWSYHVGNSPSATIGDEYLSIKHRESTIEGIVPVTWWWIIQEMVSMVRVRWFHQIEIGLLDQWRTY